MSKTLIVANWKMHFNTHQASLLLHKLEHRLDTHPGVEVVLAPNFLVLQSLSLQVNHRQFKLAAQNCYWRDEGAYTGEVSATMLRGLVQYVILGHSERRHIFGEADRDIRHKVQAALRNEITPILCVGETAAEKAAGETPHVLHAQITAGLSNVTSVEIEKMVIAYEPVWAIGTGTAAMPDDVKKAVTVIRKQIYSLYGEIAAKNVRILYGGSTDNQNAAAFLQVDGVNGLLVGGASLNAEIFTSIVAKAQEQHKTDGDK